MWALGLIVGTLVGAVVAQGPGAFVGAIIGVVAGIIVSSQRKGIKHRIDSLESQMLNLEARIKALDEHAAAPARSSAASASASAATEPVFEAPSPAQAEIVTRAMPAAAFVSTQSTELGPKAADDVVPTHAFVAATLPVRQGGHAVASPRAAAVPSGM